MSLIRCSVASSGDSKEVLARFLPLRFVMFGVHTGRRVIHFQPLRWMVPHAPTPLLHSLLLLLLLLRPCIRARHQAAKQIKVTVSSNQNA